MIPYCILVIEDDSDRAFMESLYLEYQRLIYSEVGKIIRNNWDTEDVFQNVLVNLISQIAKLRSLPRDELVRYIITTAKHTAYDYFRSRKGDNDLSYDDYIETADEGSQEDGLESRLISAEELEHLVSIWPKLDKRTRILLEGYYILEKPMSELGAELGIKPGSVRMTLSRARKKAYDLLKTELETA